MSVSFVVLAHSHEQLLRELLRELAPYPTILHIDHYSDELYSSFAREGGCPDHVTINQQPKCVHWGGFSALGAMMESLDLALRKVDPTVNHFVFLSGQCFPLQPVDMFSKYLASCERPVHCRGIPLNGHFEMGVARVTRRHWFDGIPGHMRKKFSSKVPSIVRRMLLYLLWFKKVDVPNLRHTCGSQWTAIPRSLASELVDHYKSGGFDYLRNAFAPDEVAIPTYVYNSEWALKTQMQGLEPSSRNKVSAYPNFHWLRPDMDGDVTIAQAREALMSDAYFIRKLPGTNYRDIIRTIKSTWS